MFSKSKSKTQESQDSVIETANNHVAGLTMLSAKIKKKKESVVNGEHERLTKFAASLETVIGLIQEAKTQFSLYNDSLYLTAQKRNSVFLKAKLFFSGNKKTAKDIVEQSQSTKLTREGYLIVLENKKGDCLFRIARNMIDDYQIYEKKPDHTFDDYEARFKQIELLKVEKSQILMEYTKGAKNFRSSMDALKSGTSPVAPKFRSSTSMITEPSTTTTQSGKEEEVEVEAPKNQNRNSSF